MPKQKTKSTSIIPDERIAGKIYLIHGEKVMFDRDLAELYGVKTKELNKAVKRNADRFPADFMFQLKKEEADMFLKFQIGTLNEDNLRFQNGTSSYGGRRYLPYVFTEQGVAMLSAVLKSKRAVEVSIHIVRVFVKMRKLIASHGELEKKIEKIEKENIKNRESIKAIFKIISKFMTANPKDGEVKIIGFSEK